MKWKNLLTEVSLLICVSLLALSHLALIPLLALYGVRICPVMESLGFGFGVAANGVFVTSIAAIDFVLVYVGWKWVTKSRDESADRVQGFTWISLIAHLSLFIGGALLLFTYLRANGVPDPSIARLARVIGCAAILLSVLQASIVHYLSVSWLALRSTRRRADGQKNQMRRKWLLGSAWSALPWVGLVGVGGMFLLSKAPEIAELEGGDSLAAASLNRELATVLVLLFTWLLLVKFFSLLTERGCVRRAERHLEAFGNLDPTYFSSEVGTGFWEELFPAFNRATTLMEERGRLIQAFSSYATRTVVDQVLKNRPRPQGESRELTILVADLRDFTRLSQTLSAEQVVALLNVYFADMIDVLTHQSVIVDKFIGDGILAFVEPADHSREQANQLGFQAALAMQHKLLQTNRTLAGMGLPAIKLGVAVHCGKVVLGSIGPQERLQYTMVGDAVNIASRLEGFCKQLGSSVIASAAIYQTLSTDLRARVVSLGEHAVRGVEKPIELFGLASGAPAT
jgi:class 3 adenylate cyclase